MTNVQDNTGTFQPLGNTDRRLAGTTALLACGLMPDEQARLRGALVTANLAYLPLIGVAEDAADASLRELAARPPGIATLGDPALPRAVILSGLREHELHRVMGCYRAAKLPSALWASVTPVTETWPLRQLLTELGRERAALGDAVRMAG